MWCLCLPGFCFFFPTEWETLKHKISRQTSLVFKRLTGLKSCGLGFLYGAAGNFPFRTNLSSTSRVSGGLWRVMNLRGSSFRCHDCKTTGTTLWVPFVCRGLDPFDSIFSPPLRGTFRHLNSLMEKSGGLKASTWLWFALSLGLSHLRLARARSWLAENLILSSKRIEVSGTGKLHSNIFPNVSPEEAHWSEPAAVRVVLPLLQEQEADGGLQPQHIIKRVAW